MAKLIFALHGAGPGPRLSTPAFREDLASAGVKSVQINLDDEAVAEAFRFGPGQPITALVSVWFDDYRVDDKNVRAVIAAVACAADEKDLHAYKVTEKVRLEPLPTPDGVRADVYAQVAVLRRPDSMTREEYLEYWQVHHTPIAIRTQNTCGYIQNIVEAALSPSSPEISAIVEEHFPMAGMTDPHEFHGSRGNRDELDRRRTELMSSVARFGAGDGLDLVPTSRYHWNLRHLGA